MPREGHDKQRGLIQNSKAAFQSTCPARGTTAGGWHLFCFDISFQSTCPARGTTIGRKGERGGFGRISIHVPREGHDCTML